MSVGLGIAAIIGLALACASAPLAVYIVALALFGWAHVLSEMRYVDLRFGPRVGGRLRRSLGVGLALVAVVRAGANVGWLPSVVAVPVELALVVALVVAVLPALTGRVARITAVIAAAAVAAGVAWAPVHTLLLLAVLHNFTPVGFLAEILRGPARRRALAVAAGVFLGVPLVLAGGWLQSWLAQIGWWQPELSLLGAGDLHANMGAYLPQEMRAAPWAVHVFAGAVFAQCMHYAAVIYILPRRLPGPALGRAGTDPGAAAAQAVVPWPRADRFAVAVAVFSLAMFAAFALDYRNARGAYSVAAAIHAWIELPILLLALGGRGAPARA
ncbi:hypothetical protein [Haliangium sp.]|uniref:hypothetical protein n=1 Tax=Haliangium sp. TaxID=2663208 RepID=UPI003D1386FE